MAVTINTRHLGGFIVPREYAGIAPQVVAAHDTLHNGTGLGNDYLGWVELATKYDKEEYARIKAAAQRIGKNSQVLLVIGIGGSYLGARAAIEFLRSPSYNALPKSTPDVLFVGNSLSPAYLKEIIALVGERDFSINIISKSGTTTEPALAFRVFREQLENKYGKEKAAQRIFATTDKARGTLKNLADAEKWETFVIPDDVGGRYSVLTAVGLLPIAVAGCDLDAIMRGAAKAQADLMETDVMKNPCYQYAAIRNILYNKGKATEVLVSYEPGFAMMNEWYKQLFGESQGKDQKGLFPASMIFSTDLHSLGQFVQDGSRNLFETVVNIAKPKDDFYLAADKDNLDGLNFLCEQNMSVVNQKAFLGTMLAHVEGGCPVVVLDIPDMQEHSLGYLIYFMEKACAISCYMMGLNPFDQPGVESYKANMFALLGKPGYEQQKAALEAKL